MKDIIIPQASLTLWVQNPHLRKITQKLDNNKIEFSIFQPYLGDSHSLAVRAFQFCLG